MEKKNPTYEPPVSKDLSALSATGDVPGAVCYPGSGPIQNVCNPTGFAIGVPSCEPGVNGIAGCLSGTNVR